MQHNLSLKPTTPNLQGHVNVLLTTVLFLVWMIFKSIYHKALNLF